MKHRRKNRQRRAERIRMKKAMRKVLQRQAGLDLRRRETSRMKHDAHHPWAAFLARESAFHSDECYNLDVATVLFLAPRIRLLIKGGFEKCGATPYIPELHTGDSHENWKRWHTVLKKIQFAFDTLEHCVDATGLIDKSSITNERKAMVDEGLLLFGKYLLYLTV